ncbi:MAG: hypothetical protein ACREIB_11400 [Pseudomonadota bacterium]
MHAFLLAASVPLLLGASLADYVYVSTYHVQWINFASWLIVGGLVFVGAALVCALIWLLRAGGRRHRYAVHLVLLAAAFILGLVNAFVHAADAWATMPAGLVLSLVVTVLAGVATAMVFPSLRGGGAP